MDRDHQPDDVGALVLPPPVPDPAPAGFPVLATLAPVAGAVVLWWVTGTAMALAFAALGPLAAIAAILDGRRQARRTRRTGAAERRRAFARLHEAIDDRHAAEREARRRASPSARAMLAERPGADWQSSVPTTAVIGHGVIASALRLEGRVVDEDDASAAAHAARLEGAPLRAELDGGIGFVGPASLAVAAARGVVVQVAHRTRPGTCAITAVGAGWEWVDALPHRDGAVRLVAGEPPAGEAGDGTIRVAVAGDEHDLPPGIRTVVRIDSASDGVLLRHRGRADGRPVVPELVGGREASDWALALRRAAAEAGLVDRGGELPTEVRWSALGSWDVPAGVRSSLAVAVGLGADGPVAIDLVRDGPHALVAGTTGSGKSEFLLAWLAALARDHPPDRVAFLLVDFKGGAAFAPLVGLPHVTGVVTDLDVGAHRAVTSLGAELRYREGVLRDVGARDIGDLPEAVVLPRLVIVVDEFQALAERHPDLGPVLADIAARGRSLGVHLVLAAQRPNGVVRDGIIANCPLRIALRVLSPADSAAVLGVPDAAAIPADAPGRGVLVRGGAESEPFHSARVTESELAELRRNRARDRRARRPWLDPLPAIVRAEDLRAVAGTGARAGSAGARSAPDAAGAPDEDLASDDVLVSDEDLAPDADGLVFGLVDDPERQRRGAAAWSPDRDGHLLVAGAPRSGRTSALAAIAAAFAARHGRRSVRVLDGPRSAQWDLLAAELERMRRGGASPSLLVLDDLDVRFRGWPEPHRTAALETVDALLREGRHAGLAIAASTVSASALGRSSAEWFGPALLLRHPTRADLLQAGGDPALWSPGLPPGAAQWRGLRAQVAVGEPLAPPRPEPVALLDRSALGLERGARGPDGAALVAVVSSRVRDDARAIGRLTGVEPVLLVPAMAPPGPTPGAAGAPAGPHVLVGDAEAWAANWNPARAARDDGVIVVRGGTAEFRALCRDRDLPPLLDDPVSQCWVVRPGGVAERFGWPAPDDGSRTGTPGTDADSVPDDLER